MVVEKRVKSTASLYVIRFMWDGASVGEVGVSRINKIRRVDTPNWKKPHSWRVIK
jgi:hypothetical protein